MVIRERNGSAIRIRLRGIPGREAEDELEHIVTSGLEDIEDLCIDMEGVDEIFVTMVRILSFAQCSMLRKKGSFCIVNANERVASICARNGISC